MRSTFAGILLAFSITAFSQVQTPDMDKILTSAAQSLAVVPFDGHAPVTIHGRVSILVWPQRTSGMLVVEASQGGEKYAFSTATVAAMAKQGFTRFALRPGAEVIVTGVLAGGNAKIGPGLSAARADLITKADGNRVFDRSRLP